jgi:surface antigen
LQGKSTYSLNARLGIFPEIRFFTCTGAGGSGCIPSGSLLAARRRHSSSPRRKGLLPNAWLEEDKENGVPSFAKAELSKLCFEQMLGCRRGVAARGFDGMQGVVSTTAVAKNDTLLNIETRARLCPQAEFGQLCLREGRDSVSSSHVVGNNPLRRGLEECRRYAANTTSLGCSASARTSSTDFTG